MAERAWFVGCVQDGVLRLDYKRQWDAFLKRFEGDEVEISIRKKHSQRSDAQNAYWWAVVVPLLSEHCGYSREEMHAALKAKFLGHEDLTRGLMRIGSTTKLSPQEFGDLIDQVVVWAAESLGVVIPPPTKGWRGEAA